MRSLTAFRSFDSIIWPPQVHNYLASNCMAVRCIQRHIRQLTKQNIKAPGTLIPLCYSTKSSTYLSHKINFKDQVGRAHLTIASNNCNAILDVLLVPRYIVNLFISNSSPFHDKYILGSQQGWRKEYWRYPSSVRPSFIFRLSIYMYAFPRLTVHWKLYRKNVKQCNFK